MKKSMLSAAVIGSFALIAISAGALDNTGFEAPDQGDSNWTYAPSGASWTFTPSGPNGGSGVSGPNGTWRCDSTSPDPLGDQFAFLQYASSITQDMSGLVVGATYDLSFFESYRTGHEAGNDLFVILDEGTTNEVTIYVNNNVTNKTWALRHTDQFVAQKSSYTLTFRSTYPLGTGDCTTLIDGVYLTMIDLPSISFVKITNDSDSDISAFKSYTHKLDFGAGTPGALINGVQFDATSADPANFSRTVSSGTVDVHSGNGYHNVTGHLADLMTDMYYNGANDPGGITTWTLSGLTPGETYDARIYARQWDTNPNRTVTMVFDPDGTGTVSDVTGVINEDDATTVGMSAANDAYYINYRFTAVSAEDMVITVTQYNLNNSWHLYGMSCEVVQPVLETLSPTDDREGVLPGVNLKMTFSDNVLKGSGNITLKKSSDDSVVEVIDVDSSAVTVNGAEVIINPGSDFERETGYYVLIDEGAFVDHAGRGCPAVTDSSVWNFTTVPEIFSFVHITGDADCDIKSYKTYTHKLDFGDGTPGALVNGVQFDAYNAASNGSLNFSRTATSGNLTSHPGNGNHNVSGGLAALMTDMVYNNENAAGGVTTWTLSGLTPGTDYIARIYARRWDVGARTCSMVFDPDGAGPISDSISRILEDDATTVGMDAVNDAYYISYPFTAVAGENLVITVTQHDGGDSWHLYGITNEVIPPNGTLVIIN